MVTASPAQLQSAYDHCLHRVHSHYENFPVASLILPRHLRQPIAVIYAFARTADDLADEGDLPPPQRLQQLDSMAQQLDRLGEADTDPIFLALADVIQQYDLPLSLLHDLLSAFRQDVSKTRYASYAEVLDYCRRSANPVGRLLLHLTKQDSANNLAHSDAICSALQLINFLQDIGQDVDENDRIYLPEDEMAEYGVTVPQVQQHRCDEALQQLLAYQRKRTKQLMLSGAPLGRSLPGRFGLQIRMVIQGGLKVLDLLEKDQMQCFGRPRLNKLDWFSIAARALLMRTT
jgi:squalene synthase HpnC